MLIRPERGVPDGITVDDEGALWVAMHGAGRGAPVRAGRRHPVGLALPVSQPTSVAIGGASGRRLFVTTAWENMTPEQRAGEPDAGRVFAVDDVGVSAPPVRPFRGRARAGFQG